MSQLKTVFIRKSSFLERQPQSSFPIFWLSVAILKSSGKQLLTWLTASQWMDQDFWPARWYVVRTVAQTKTISSE